ncbi:HAD-like protein [Phlebopus sp. FC_14]|nr:HAD-like protein [Phlebopus sp. FC_14]
MHTFEVDAILFDLDGTLIDSTPGVKTAWIQFASEYQFDASLVMEKTHGRRLVDTLREHCHLDDEERIKQEVVRFEGIVSQATPDVLPGAQHLLDELNRIAPERWTIVTSASRQYARKVIESRIVPEPAKGYVTSDDVIKGKPNPDPYILGAAKLGVDPTNCLVVEDAPSGLKAGREARAKTLAVCTSHTAPDQRKLLHPDAHYIVQDLTLVSVNRKGDKIEVSVPAPEALRN